MTCGKEIILMAFIDINRHLLDLLAAVQLDKCPIL